MYLCMHAYMYVYICVCKHVCIYVCIYAYVYMYVFIYVYMLYMMCMMCMMCMCMHTCMHMHMHMHMYMYMYVCIYLRHIAPSPMCAYPRAIVCVDVRDYQSFPSIMWIMRMSSRGQDWQQAHSAPLLATLYFFSELKHFRIQEPNIKMK